MKISNFAWLVALALSVFLLTASPARRTGLRFDRSVSSHTTLAVADGPVPEPKLAAVSNWDGPVPEPKLAAASTWDGPVPEPKLLATLS